MMLLFICFLTTVTALTPERAALCRFAEAIPHLRTIGWQNCTEITDSSNLVLFTGILRTNTEKYSITISNPIVTGTLPDVFTSLPDCEGLTLAGTSLSGTLPASLTASKLSRFTATDNPNLGGTLPEFPPTLVHLQVQNTPFVGTLPDLRRNVKLIGLRISSTPISGTIPSFEENTALVNVQIIKTRIAGALPDFSRALNLLFMTITNNPMTGTLPSGLPPKISMLDFGANRLSGTIPVSYFDYINLIQLHLAGNDLSGLVPWKAAAFTSVNFGNNRLSGPLPATPFAGNMVLFYLQNNQFSGTLPATFFQSTAKVINTINLANNRLEGTLPDDFSGLQNTVDLNFANNSFSGPIPMKLFSSLSKLQYILLQNNKFNGTLSGAFQTRTYAAVNLANNSLSGSIPPSFFSGANFVSLDVSGNAFTGCGPFEPSVNLGCDFGGAYYSGCTPSYGKCSRSFLDNCPRGSDHFGPTCKRCNCSSGLLCNDGVSGDGTCDAFNPCRGNNCEGICTINGLGFVCSCPFPAIINTTDQRSCNCPFGFTKKEQGGACLACPSIDNCLQIESCGICSVCRTGYKLSLLGCELDKNCLFSEWTAWSKCGDCAGGITLRYRNLSEKNTALPFYCQEFLYNATACGYPCVETTLTSKDAILDYLYRSYTQWNWLASATNATSVNITKTANLLLIAPFSNVSWLKQSVREILPLVNDTRYRFSLEGDTVSIEVLEEEQPNVVGIAVGVSVGAVFMLSAALLFLFRRKQKRWLFDLPEELQFYFNPKGSGWVTEGSCQLRGIAVQDTAFQNIWSRLSTQAIAVESVCVVSNSMLGASFSNYRSILRQRIAENPILFCKKDWLLREGKNELRSYVHERYLQLAEYFTWNDPEETVPILACLHATDFTTAKSIASKGFCALATLDEGFYGKGIYFSTYGSYVAPYFLGKEQPAILVNLVVGGNAFPVVEAAAEKDSFLGKPTASGYQSHFVLTKSDGTPVTAMHTEDESNEIVVSQEAQVVPIYIVRVARTQRLEQFSRSSASLMTPLLVDESYHT